MSMRTVREDRPAPREPDSFMRTGQRSLTFTDGTRMHADARGRTSHWPTPLGGGAWLSLGPEACLHGCLLVCAWPRRSPIRQDVHEPCAAERSHGEPTNCLPSCDHRSTPDQRSLVMDSEQRITTAWPKPAASKGTAFWRGCPQICSKVKARALHLLAGICTPLYFAPLGPLCYTVVVLCPGTSVTTDI